MVCPVVSTNLTYHESIELKVKSEGCEGRELGASRHIKGGGERLPCSALLFPMPLNCKDVTGKKRALYSPL